MMPKAARFIFSRCISVLMALLFHGAHAEDSASKSNLPVEVEKPLGELLKKAGYLKTDAQMEELNKAIADIVSAAKVGDDIKKRLEVEAKAVVDRSLKPWKEKLDAKLRPFLRQDLKESLEMLSQWPAEMLIKSEFVPESGKLAEQDDWKNALKKILPPEQLALMEKKEQESEQAQNKEIQDQIKPMVDVMRKNQGLVFKNAASDVKSVLGLTGDRAKKVEAMTEEFAKRAVAAYEKRISEELKNMAQEMRAQFNMRRGRMPFGEEGIDNSSDMEEWKTALKGFLSEDEQKRWEVASNSRQDRQDKAMAMIFLSHLDSVVLFTAAQREKMEPLAIKIMSKVPTRERENFSFNSGYVSKFDAEELKLILDEKQIQHLQDSNGNMRGHRNGEVIAEKDEQEVAGNDVDLDLDEDAIFSAYFNARDKTQRDKLADGFLVKLEDIKRVANPSDESIQRLEIASRGAAEHALDFWRPNFENWVRSSMRNVTPKALKQRLATLNRDVSFGEQAATFDQPIWSYAVTDALTDSQMEIWMNEVQGRKNYHDRARVLMILAELDRRFHLNLDQFQKLEPLLTEAVAEYAGDFNRMFSGGSGEMPRYMIVLLAGVPEEKTKGILTPEQFEQWQNADSAQFKSWWENIKNSHDARKKNGANRIIRE